MYVRSTLVLAVVFAFCGSASNSFRSAAFASPQQLPAEHTAANSQGRLTDQSKLQLVRFVSGEYAKVVQALPRKDIFTYRVEKPLDSKQLHDMVRTHGAAANPGDRIQITKLDFESSKIVVEINGGGKQHFHLRDHLQIGMGPTMAPVGTTNGHPGEGLGTTFVLDYGHPLHEMTPDDLKHTLSPLLDFGNQTSATVSWIDTVPKEFRQAIQDHQAAVGMDEDMVIAALGRPEHKVREKDDQGKDTEDWIYGDPPAKTVFVTFSAGKVVRVKEFND